MSYGAYGFTVYNPLNDTINLRFPPLSAAISSFKGAGKQAAKAGWAVKVAPTTASGLALNPVYCGFAPSTVAGASFYPVPPSLEDVGVGVCDDQTGAVRGQKIAHALNGGGC